MKGMKVRNDSTCGRVGVLGKQAAKSIGQFVLNSCTEEDMQINAVI